MFGYVRVDVEQRDQCGTVSDNPLHHAWVVVICICFIRFVIKVSLYPLLGGLHCLSGFGERELGY